MLRRFSDLSCEEILCKNNLLYCFYSLILAFVISLGYINIANAHVCFLPDGADCAQGDTEGFWPCVGDGCGGSGGKNSKCDASYNSNRSTNECGAACTRCADTSSPYNGLYKCPENTCNCNDYTSDNSYNECGESCSVCRIVGDKNYGKYKCKPVPATGCPNPCKDCTLTEAQARAKMAADPCMECEQGANLNCTDAQRSKWRCSENKLCKQCRAKGYNKDKNSSEYTKSRQTCSRMQCEECPYNDISEGIEWYKCSECGSEYTQNYHNITNPQDKVNHCYENETCGCYMKCDSCFGYDYTMQDCKNAGYDNAKNPCPTTGKRGTVYEKCCNTCNGYMYSSDLSKTSEGWSCTPCNNYCSGGTKYSCGCKAGYHSNGNGGCEKDCAVVTCGTAITSKPANSSYTTCTSRTTTCAETTINTGWECNSGFHKNSAGNGCNQNCAVVTCGTAITSKPSNSSYTTCTSRTTTCAETTINTGWKCKDGYHKNSAGTACDQNCAVVTCGTAITSKPSNSSYTTCTSRTTTCAETTINTGWKCNSGYQKNSAGTGCEPIPSCAVVTCNKVTVPSNAHGTTTCQAKNADCSNNGSAVYTAWECNTDFKMNSAGTGCVAKSCADGGYEEACTVIVSDNGCKRVTCEPVTYAGKTCYVKKTKTLTRPTNCSAPTCANLIAQENGTASGYDITVLGATYGYQVSGYTNTCYNQCGIPEVTYNVVCPSSKHGNASIILIKCCR